MLTVQNPQGPQLAEVLAFTMLEPIEDVARVHSTASLRLSRGNPWSLCRVVAVDISDEADDLARISITARCISDIYSDNRMRTFEFLASADNSKRSERFDAFLQSAGIKERVEDEREIKGRCFAVRNRGKSASDFGAVEDFLFPAFYVAS